MLSPRSARTRTQALAPGSRDVGVASDAAPLCSAVREQPASSTTLEREQHSLLRLAPDRRRRRAPIRSRIVIHPSRASRPYWSRRPAASPWIIAVSTPVGCTELPLMYAPANARRPRPQPETSAPRPSKRAGTSAVLLERSAPWRQRDPNRSGALCQPLRSTATIRSGAAANSNRG